MNKVFIVSLCSVVSFLLGVLYGSNHVNTDLADKLSKMDEQTVRLTQSSYELGLKLGYLTRHHSTNKQNIEALIAAGWPNAAAAYDNQRHLISTNQ